MARLEEKWDMSTSSFYDSGAPARKTHSDLDGFVGVRLTFPRGDNVLHSTCAANQLVRSGRPLIPSWSDTGISIPELTDTPEEELPGEQRGRESNSDTGSRPLKYGGDPSTWEEVLGGELK